MKEVWKEHPEFKGYWVSDRGRVKNVNGRILKQHLTRPNNTYYAVQMKKPGDEKYHRVYVHKIVLEAFVGPRPDSMVCCHGVGGPKDNSLDNLSWGTVSQNAIDRLRDGTDSRGHKSPTSKLTIDDVNEIFRLRKLGMSTCEIARRVGCQRSNVGFILRKETWKNHPSSLGEGFPSRITAKGELNGSSKLSESQVKKIKIMRQNGKKLKEIAHEFGITATNVSFICNGRTWSHVKV